MDAGGAWERLLHTPTTWIVVAVVLFVVAVLLLVAGARAGRASRAARAQGEQPTTAPAVDAAGAEDDEPVTEPSAPRAAPVPDHPDEPAAQQRPDRAQDPALRLLGVLVGDPSGAVAGVAALQRGEDPGPAAVTLLRSGVPAPAVAQLCGVDAEDLGDLVAAALGVLEVPSASEQKVSL